MVLSIKHERLQLQIEINVKIDMMSSTANFLLLIVVAAAAAAASSSLAGAACAPKEREALLAFKHGITSDPTNLLESWEPDEELDCCKWGGVQCRNRTGHVLELDLGGGGLVGEISHSLLSLQHLEHLNFSMNSLQGPTGLVPQFLGSFKNLRYLDLSDIPFYGIVPPQLGNLSKLQYLDISANMMYSLDLSWLTHLPLLEYLNMRSVDLVLIDDWPYMVNMLPSLRVLNLAYCSFTRANQPLSRLNHTNLEVLDLTGNSFHHPIASCWFWNVTSLEYFYLVGTDLYGQLPDRLGDMVSLQALVLEDFSNNLTMTTVNMRNLCNLTVIRLDASLSYGNITELIESLPRCSSNKLQELYLSSNNLTGSLPNLLGHLTSLTFLDLTWNNITGSLPASIGNFTNLRGLLLCTNHFSGHVPSEIGKLSALTRLELCYNDFYGLITEEHFDGLRSLKHMFLQYNQLKIVVGSKWLPTFRLKEAHLASIELGPLFPAWLKGQVDIRWIDISNTSINDTLPDWFSNTFSKVTFMVISENQIYGDLPRNMNIMSLDSLYLNSNNLTGQIPPLPKYLSVLDISENSLSGPLPSNFGAPQLSLISLYSNRISGQVPTSLCQLSLYSLDLANNLFEGELPGCMNMTGMTYLLLSNNSFSGNFPPSLRSATSLRFLDLSWNRFSGPLPGWIGSFSSLQFLRLHHNMFYGHIPDNITSLQNLYHLNLAANQISGVIPPHVSNLTFMTRMYVHKPGTLPADFLNMVGELIVDLKRQKLKYRGVAVLEILSIDFSSNYLTGEIPHEITSLDGLVSLNLSWNKLSGVVPNKIGDMKYLEWLDLSNNNLTGEIPSSMSNLTYLSTLDLSNNNLTGKIPSGGQLDTLYTENPSMYDGNAGLCGLPLQRICPHNNTSDQGNETGHEKISGQMFFYFGLGIGYLIGLWAVFCALLFKKAWRIAYFRLFDKYYDKIYVFVVVTRNSFTRKADTRELPQIN